VRPRLTCLDGTPRAFNPKGRVQSLTRMTAVNQWPLVVCRTSETLAYFFGLTPARWGLVQLPSGQSLATESSFGNDWELFCEDGLDFLGNNLVLHLSPMRLTQLNVVYERPQSAIHVETGS
jgi:hypothetical protein